MKLNKELIKPVIVAVMTYLFCYVLPKMVVDESLAHFIIISLDSKIPFHSEGIYMYVLAFLQWFVVIVEVCKKDTLKGYRLASAVMIGSIIGCIIFIAYPTAITRDFIVGNSFSDKLYKFIIGFDSTINALPSFHCFCSTMCVIALFVINDIKPAYRILNLVITILVFISTVVTKQHYILDIPSGILLAIVAYTLSKYVNFNKLFERINKKAL